MGKGTIYKTTNGYNWDSQDIFTWIMHYNKDGSYRGQTQSDVMGEGDILLPAEMIDGFPCVNGKPVKPLSAEEMACAE